MASIASRSVFPLTAPLLFSLVQPLNHGMLQSHSESNLGHDFVYGNYVLDGLFQHIVAVPTRDGDESHSLGIVTNLLDEGGCLLDDFIEPILTPLGSIIRLWVA